MENQNTRQLRILAVDDDQTTLAIYQEIFTRKDPQPHEFPETDIVTAELFDEQLAAPALPAFKLITCSCGEDAVETIATSLEKEAPFSVVFMDVHLLGEADGIQAAEQIRHLDPNVEMVLVTEAHDVLPQTVLSRIPPVHKLLYVQKPVSQEEIKQCAASLGVRWQTDRELHKAHEQLEDWMEARTIELMQTNDRLEGQIEERRRMEDALRKNEEKYRVVLESVPDPVVVYDPYRRVTYVNPSFSRIFDWSLEQCFGQELDFIPSEYAPDMQLIWNQIDRGQTISSVETQRLAHTGKLVDVSISGAGFFDEHRNLQGSVMTLQDITERKKTEEEIKYIAYHDVLTGLPNRKSFYVRLEDKVVQSRSRSGSLRRAIDHKWALLFLDLDRFKYINDTLGHDVGDELLTIIASRLQTCVRESDYVFRLGGDEFTVILNALIDGVDVGKVAQKIRGRIAEPCMIDSHELHVTTSIGISVYPDDGADVERLVKNADMAMYAAKEEGLGYRFFTEEMNSKALERMVLESNLRNALRESQFVLYYQPLVNTHGHIVGMEALIRWQHPELGVISPAKFIPLAEETGAIVEIGKWVLHTACQQAKYWHDMGFTKIQIAVNLSTRQFKEADLIRVVEQVLEDTGLSPEALKLEVTESGIMEEPEKAIEKMKLLRAKGIHFAIDDFGTGYSSLGYLKRFPVDTLKIDRSFVMDATTNKDDQEIIKTIISMAQNLNLDTVAEGVETQEQQEFLISSGCHVMQGYYFGRPVPEKDFERLLLSKQHLPAL